MGGKKESKSVKREGGGSIIQRKNKNLLGHQGRRAKRLLQKGKAKKKKIKGRVYSGQKPPRPSWKLQTRIKAGREGRTSKIRFTANRPREEPRPYEKKGTLYMEKHGGIIGTGLGEGGIPEDEKNTRPLLFHSSSSKRSIFQTADSFWGEGTQEE